jgi:hypothetical protein
MTFDTKATFAADGTFHPDALVAGNAHLLVGKKVTLLMGENRTRGAVLGAIVVGAAVAAAKAGGNTGTGGLVMDAAPVQANAIPGVYTVRCVAAVADKGTFEVKDPKGKVIEAELYSSLGGTAFNDQVKFVITTITGHDFIVGDGFDITVTGTSKYKLSAAAALDGSQVPDAILAEDCDATAADKEALVYVRGDFNANSLTLGAGQTVAGITDTLRGKGITVLPAMA